MNKSTKNKDMTDGMGEIASILLNSQDNNFLESNFPGYRAPRFNNYELHIFQV